MSLDAIIDQHKAKIRMALLFALVFSLGFGSGYYYLDGQGSTSSLVLRDQSGECLGLFKPDAQVAPSGKVAAAQTDSTGAEAALPASGAPDSVPAVSTSKSFAGSKNSTLYHSRDCQYVKRIKAENLVWFGSQKEAEAAGKKPHSCVGS